MDFKDEIITFINQNETEGALLITGEWGCGKTYFLKSLIHETQEKNRSNEPCDYVFALISLYGIDSIDSLHKEVKKAVLEAQSISNEKDNTFFSKFKNIAQPLTESLKESSKIANVMNVALQINPWDFLEVKNEITCYGVGIKDVTKRLVLLFDDLERCKLNIADLLGAINFYVETRKIKTIIVANEKKLNEKTDFIEFKEKTILRTLYFMQNCDLIITSFIDNYEETPIGSGFIKVIREKLTIPTLCEIFKQSNCNNYRLLKRALINAERYFNIIHNNCNSLISDASFYKYAMYQFIVVFIEYQISNITIEQLKQKKNWREYCKKYDDFTFSFLSEFVQNCINKGVWDSKPDMICDTIVNIKKYQEFSEHKLKANQFFDTECSSDTFLNSAIFLAENKVGPVELATISFGQRFEITPLQLITAVSALANGGILVKPQIVSKTVNSVGVNINTASPSILKYVSGITKKNIDKIIEYRDSKGRINSRIEILTAKTLGEDQQTQIDVNVKEYKLATLRKKISIALQKSELFSTTIFENINRVTINILSAKLILSS